jgi:hypothetical protein
MSCLEIDLFSPRFCSNLGTSQPARHSLSNTILRFLALEASQGLFAGLPKTNANSTPIRAREINGYFDARMKELGFRACAATRLSVNRARERDTAWRKRLHLC